MATSKACLLMAFMLLFIFMEAIRTHARKVTLDATSTHYKLLKPKDEHCRNELFASREEGARTRLLSVLHSAPRESRRRIRRLDIHILKYAIRKFMGPWVEIMPLCLIMSCTLMPTLLEPNQREESADFTWVQTFSIMFDSHTFVLAAKRISYWDDNVDALIIWWDCKEIVVPTEVDVEWKTNDGV
ncbi:hypothetical protein Scep_004890 [Stephania cephalantha]|uniref:Uncharacterized protein n=1 Tax=Stephania cephalantha TaxID=152367 RepID=A0AAP0KTA6_9MAGN